MSCSDNGYDFYNGIPPHQAGSDTSKAAAESVGGEAGTLRGAVYQCLIRMGLRGATDAELQNMLGMSVSTEVPRRRELVLSGVVKDSGYRRLTPTGRQATVWVASDMRGKHSPVSQHDWRSKYEVAAQRIFVLEGELTRLRALLGMEK